MGPKKLHQKLHHTLWFWQVLISKKPNKNAYLHDEKQGEEKSVIDAAMTAAGAGTGKVWNAAADPVADVDAAIQAYRQRDRRYGGIRNEDLLPQAV